MPSVPLNVTVTVRLPELIDTVRGRISARQRGIAVFHRHILCDVGTVGGTPAKSTGSTHWDKVSVMEKTLIFAEEVMLE